MESTAEMNAIPNNGSDHCNFFLPGMVSDVIKLLLSLNSIMCECYLFCCVIPNWMLTRTTLITLSWLSASYP